MANQDNEGAAPPPHDGEAEGQALVSRTSRGPGSSHDAFLQRAGVLSAGLNAHSLRLILRMAKKPEPRKLFWLIYRHSDGSAAGVAVIESRGLLHARLKASLAGADREQEFASGHQLAPLSAELIPANMIGVSRRRRSPEAAPHAHQEEAACAIGAMTDGREAQSWQTMTRRKGEINRGDLTRKWSHHVALPAEMLRGLSRIACRAQ